jgi:hypothetical protein
MTGDLGPLDRLADRAESLAGAWAARARTSTTVGRERAMLRLFGVTGLDSAGRPLAWAVIDRYLAGGQDRLSAGVALPFAMALVEYDLDPQRLALDVASGAVDLGLEANLLREPDRRVIAEEEARRLAAGAIERIDANRTARTELIGVLGDPGRPWIGTAVGESDLLAARDEARAAVEAGADLLQVDVPIGRELSERLRMAGLDAPTWQPRPGQPDATEDVEHAPTGSQRALAGLRRALDEAAARRRGYVRLAIVPPALGTPESAVVAAFERIDLAASDPLAEIVAGRVAPDRALADHAFAQALLARAGVAVSIGAGPLVVAPDLARGLPSDTATRAGRALALQLLSVVVARGNGLTDDQIYIGALTPWVGGESGAAVQAAAEVALRHALFPSLGLVFEEPRPELRPEGAEASGELWAAIAAAIAPGDATAAVLRRSASLMTIRSTRVQMTVAATLAKELGSRPLAGAAADHAKATAAAALRTLERLGDEGWRSVIGDSLDGPSAARLGADAVAERSEAFDPLGSEIARVG